MFGFIKRIFSGLKVTEVMDKVDDWKLTSEEKVKYKMEFLRTMPTGFQLSQRVIGLSFTFVYLLMISIVFGQHLYGIDINEAREFISDTMSSPMTAIFVLFFGGGVVDSIKRKPKRVD